MFRRDMGEQIIRARLVGPQDLAIPITAPSVPESTRTSSLTRSVHAMPGSGAPVMSRCTSLSSTALTPTSPCRWW